jgi:eukaryotic-like serine/threonine-protein kinase
VSESDGVSTLRDEVQQALTPDYALERELGRGGMGAVFLARDLALDRPVAVKVLPPEFAARHELRERFLRETRTAASFSHPNVVPVHAVEERGNVLCFVMGFVDGETLTQHVRRAGPLGAAEATRLIQEVAWALSYAHGRGVVHRDVKPDNILIERATGRALVTDFGIARSAALSGLTMVGEVVGTPQFMSPEQAAGETVDGRSDLYSLGAVAFFAVTGRLLFDAPNAQAILAMHITRPAPSAASLRPDLPAPLAAAIDRLLAKHPGERFQTGEELVEALDSLRAARPEVAPPIRLFHVRANTALRNMGVILSFMPFLALRMKGEGNQLLLLMIVVIAALMVIFQILGWMRDLAREGFRYEDLRGGLLTIAAEQEEASKKFHGPREGTRLRDLLLFMTGSGLAGGLIGLGASMGRRTNLGWWGRPLMIALFIVGAGLALLAVMFMLARTRNSTQVDRRLARLWTGGLGRRAYALAARNVTSERGAPGAVPTPGDRGPLTILHELPKPLRRRLSGVEPGIRRLQSARDELEQRDTQLAAALGEASRPGSSSAAEDERRRLVEELTAARREVGERRDAIDAALERVRLELLRVKTGLSGAERVKAELERAQRIDQPGERTPSQTLLPAPSTPT